MTGNVLREFAETACEWARVAAIQPLDGSEAETYFKALAAGMLDWATALDDRDERIRELESRTIPDGLGSIWWSDKRFAYFVDLCADERWAWRTEVAKTQELVGEGYCEKYEDAVEAALDGEQGGRR